MPDNKKQDPISEAKPDVSHREKEDALVDAGSEYSFPASDPPSYMGGTAVAGPPPHDEPPREPVCRELLDSDAASSDDEKPRLKNHAPGPDKDR